MNFTAFRFPAFRLYFLGVLFSVNGLWMLMVSVSWTAWQLSGSAAFVGLVATLAILPTILLGPFFGVLVDRINIKHAYFGTNLGMGSVAAFLLFLEDFGLTTRGLIILVAMLMGLVSAAHGPTRLSLGPRLVARDHIASVVTLAALNFNIARFITPALTGLIIDRAGVQTVLVIILFLYLPNLLIAGHLQPRDREIAPEAEGFFTSFKKGLSYVTARPTILWILAFSALYNGSMRGTTELLAVIADGAFGKGAAGLGQLASSVGFGALVAAISKGILNPQRFQSLTPLVFLFAAIGISSVTLLGNAGSWSYALAACTTIGFTATFLGITVQSIIQSDLPDHLRARVMSLWVVVAMGSPAVGAFVIGNTAQIWSMGSATIGATCVALTGMAVIFWQLQKRA